MTQEQLTINRIPLKERVAFQLELAKFMLKMKEKDWEEINDDDEKEIRRHNVQSEWEADYSDSIHKIIDDESRDDNKIIRPLIMEGRNKEASIEVLKALKSELEKDPEKYALLEWVSKALELELVHN